MSTHSFRPDARGLVHSCPQCGQANRLTYDRVNHAFRCASCNADLSSPNEPVEIPSAAIFDALIGSSALPVLVDFWAPWCGPCRMVAPELVKVASAGAGRWLVVKVNTEDLPELGQRFGIASIPTLCVFISGRQVARQAGAMGAAQIVQFIEGAL